LEGNLPRRYGNTKYRTNSGGRGAIYRNSVCLVAGNAQICMENEGCMTYPKAWYTKGCGPPLKRLFFLFYFLVIDTTCLREVVLMHKTYPKTLQNKMGFASEEDQQKPSSALVAWHGNSTKWW